jgi:hypothetical protein
MIVGLTLGLRGENDGTAGGLGLSGVQDMERMGTKSVFVLRQEEALDVLVPSPTPLPSQGRTRVAAAEDNLEGYSDGEARRELSVVSYTVSYAALREIIAAYDWPINEAFAIVDCESVWTSGAVSWTGESFGLFQIHAIHAYRWPNFWSEWMNPEVNTAWAFEIWLERGWGPWDCW